MGGAVSSGRDNNELIDNLLGSKYIRSAEVELAFRALDRADYMVPGDRARAYKDLAWRSGALHLSAPCIYSEVLEGLELRPGLSFLNIGSGTGYLSTLAGLLLGAAGLSHGVELHPAVLDYANGKLKQFMESSPALDEFDFCEPKFYLGNGLSLAPLPAAYDRVYCGAGCPDEYQNYFKQLLRVGGVLVMPLRDSLLQVRRVAAAEWRARSLLSVNFEALRPPLHAETPHVTLEEQAPARLQQLARAAVRGALRGALLARHPQLRPPAPRPPPPPRAHPPPAHTRRGCPRVRRICIPIDDDSDAEGLNALHDLDPETGANEMNALLSLVLSMGHNRVAGALQLDPADTSDSADSGTPATGDSGDDAGAEDEGGGGQQPRGRLSLTLEYSAPPPRDSDADTEPGSPPGAGERGGRKRQSRGSGDECRCERQRPGTSAGARAEAEAAAAAGQKRQKVDSGLGDDGTPSPSSDSTPPPPARPRTRSCSLSSTGSSTHTTGDTDVPSERRRLPKRSRCDPADLSSSSGSGGDGSGGGEEADTRRRRRRKRRAGGAGAAQTARRAALSQLLQRSVRSLPLPPALQVYVNLGRTLP